MPSISEKERILELSQRIAQEKDPNRSQALVRQLGNAIEEYYAALHLAVPDVTVVARVKRPYLA